MKKKIWGMILQIPVWILLLAIFVSFIYLSVKGFGGQAGIFYLKYGLLIWIIIILYIIGKIIERMSDEIPYY
jgi:hypothetical protein